MSDRYWLNQFFHETQKAEGLAAYRANPSVHLDRFALSVPLRQAVEGIDIASMYRAGANPYLLRFFCVNMGIREPEYLAAMHAIDETSTLATRED